MSNETKNRPDQRDELDIDSLIRSIREEPQEAEGERAEEPAPGKQQPKWAAQQAPWDRRPEEEAEPEEYWRLPDPTEPQGESDLGVALEEETHPWAGEADPLEEDSWGVPGTLTAEREMEGQPDPVNQSQPAVEPEGEPWKEPEGQQEDIPVAAEPPVQKKRSIWPFRMPGRMKTKAEDWNPPEAVPAAPREERFRGETPSDTVSSRPMGGEQEAVQAKPAAQRQPTAQAQQETRRQPAVQVQPEPGVQGGDTIPMPSNLGETVQSPIPTAAAPGAAPAQQTQEEIQPAAPAAHEAQSQEEPAAPQADEPTVPVDTGALERERQAFASGQVITLNLHQRSHGGKRQNFQQTQEDQAEEQELEAIWAAGRGKPTQGEQSQPSDQPKAPAPEGKEPETAPGPEQVQPAGAPQQGPAPAQEPEATEGKPHQEEELELPPVEPGEAELAFFAKVQETQETSNAPTGGPSHRSSGAQSYQVLTVQLGEHQRKPASSGELDSDLPWDTLPPLHSQQTEKSLEQEALDEQFALPKRDHVPELLHLVPDAPEPEAEEPKETTAQPAAPTAEGEADRVDRAEWSHGDPEDADDQLESMLAAHAGPAVPLTKSNPMESNPSQAPQTPDGEEAPTQVIPPVGPSAEEPQPAASAQEGDTKRLDRVETEAPEPPVSQGEAQGTAQPDGEAPQTNSTVPPEQEQPPQEDWDEEELADESLLEPPTRGPGLGSRLLGLLGGLLRRPQEDEEEEPDAPEEKVIEMPQKKASLWRRKLDEMEERANDFADAMFQSESEEALEEEAEYKKAEQFIPGTDEERKPPQRPKRERKPKEPIRRAPDTSPKQLSRMFHDSWKSSKGRLPFQLILAVLLIVLGAVATEGTTVIQIPAFAEIPQLPGILLAAGLALACVLGLDTLLEGLFELFRGRPGLNTLSSIGVVMTLVDSVWYSVLSREGPLPFCGFAALSLWAVAWGNCRKKQGNYQACQMAAAVSQPQRLTLDQGKWDQKGTFVKEKGTAKGFGSQIQEPDGAQQVYRYAAPVMLFACLVFGILAAVGQGGPQHLVWNWSVIFVLATPLSATLAYGVPYTKLVRRLNRSGVILAGWEGADSMRGEAGIAILDTDLFPEGYVQFKGIKNFGQVSLEKLTGCTASVIREMDLGIAKIFDDQIRTQGGFYRRVDDLKVAEGGFSGVIRGDQVLIGCADYMNLMGVPLKQGYQVRNAVFCVINGQLQGIFSLNYTLANNVKPALQALIHGGVNPILATRDFNITPMMLSQRFHLPVERMEYPPVDRRHLLSAQGQPHNATLGALIFREGLGACADAILGGRRLRTVVHLNTLLAVAASAVGGLLGFYLAMMGAYYSLSPLNILFFLVMWLIPTLLISHGVDKF